MPNRKNVTVALDDERHEKLVAIAAKQERSIGYLVRQAVNEWLAKQEPVRE